MAQAERIIYDTHAEIRELTDAGFSERQAEAVVRGQVRFFERNLATKDDIGGIRAEVGKSRLASDAKIKTAKASTIIWIVGLVAILNATVFGSALVSMAWIADSLLKVQ